MRNYQIFLGLSVLSFVLANVVYQVSQESAFDLRGFLILGFVYGASIFLRGHLYSDSTTFFDFDHRGLHKPKEDLVIFGNRVDDLAEQSKERRVLIDLLDFGGHRYRIYVGWILSVALTIFISFRFGGFYFASGVVSILTLSAIYFAPFVHQLLIPLFLSFALALYGFFENRSFALVAVFVCYLMVFVGALLAFREIDADRANPRRRFRLSKFLLSNISIVFVLVAIYWSLDLILPKQSPFAKSVLPKAEMATIPSRLDPLDGVSRDIAEKVIKWQENRRQSSTGPSGPSDRAGTGDGPPGGEGGQGGSKNSAGDSMRHAHNTSPSNAKKSSGASDLSMPSGESTSSTEMKTNTSSANQETAAPKESSAMESDRESRGETERGAADGTRPSTASDTVPSTAGAPAAKASGVEESSGDATSAAGGPGTTAPAAQAAPTTAPAKTDSAGPPSAATAAEAPAERERKIKDLQSKVKLPLEVLKGLLFVILAGAALFAVAKFFSKPKDDSEKQIRQQILTQRQKQKLKSILNQIRAKNLSSDLEVIETYNALLAVFEMGHHSREEWLPAEDFSREIAKVIPSLSEDFGGATHRFATTLYGQKPVAPKDLEVFRAHVARVLKFFQLA